MDANAWSDLVRMGHKFPLHVAGNDGCNDDAVGAADVSKDTATVGLPLLHGIWILRHLARSRSWNLCARSGVSGGGDAVGIF